MSIVATMIGELSHQTNPQREQGPNAPQAVMCLWAPHQCCLILNYAQKWISVVTVA